jgi:hypothetical protein
VAQSLSLSLSVSVTKLLLFLTSHPHKKRCNFYNTQKERGECFAAAAADDDDFLL